LDLQSLSSNPTPFYSAASWWIPGKQTANFATGSKIEVQSTDFAVAFSVYDRNSSHPTGGWYLIPALNKASRH
jgi:hypothetical protein